MGVRQNPAIFCAYEGTQVCQLLKYVRNEWSYTFTPAYAFVACQRTTVRVRGINDVRRLENCTAEPLVPKVRIGIETVV